MQAAHSTSSPVALSFDVVLVELPLPVLLPAALAAVLVVAMFATDGAVEPPHPAASSADATDTMAAQRTVGRRQHMMLGGYLEEIPRCR
jgi:hypothetical protein